MKKIRVGINGFGRIGRNLARLLLNQNNIKLVAVNDIADVTTLAHLLQYDSVHGQLDQHLSVDGDVVHYKEQSIQFYQQKSPDAIPWDDQEVDIVVEASGIFKTRETAQKHLNNSVKKVIISAPSSDESVPMVVMGINDHILTSQDDIISNSSCTTNSAAPLVAIMKEISTIQSCYITTIHSFTSDQKLHDAPHKDLRRARAATQSIVPTTTGAAKAITKIFPDLSNVIGGCGIRVPVPDGSLTDMTFVVDQAPSIEKINHEYSKAANNKYQNILGYTEDPIVSVDIVGNSKSCLFDAQLTSVIGNTVKVVGWYDNEIGYSNRIIDLIEKVNQL